MTNPPPGSKLSSASATFIWTAGTGATAYSLYIGTTPGAHDIAFINAGAATSTTVNNLPTNGGTFYVRLNSLVSGTWQSTTYSYIASGTGTAATMTSPAPGTKLTSATATFVWTAGAGVTSYSLYIGTTAGAHDIAFINAGTATSKTVTNLPTNGGTFYVKLNSLIGASWQAKSYTYIASGTGTAATMTSPAPSSTLTSSTVTFVWTAGAGVSAYSLYIGTTSGAHDIAFINAGTATTKTVTGLPVNGGTFYVTLNSLIGASWHANTYHYIASGTGTPAVMTSPSPGSTLPSTSATFVWTTGAGVTAYSLYIGTTAGAHDIAFFNMGTATSKAVTGLPNNGNKFYVTLNSLIGASWHGNTYTYTATGVALVFTTTQKDVNNGLINAPFATYFEVSGGVSPYTYTLGSGSIPSGLSFSSTNRGQLAGTPTVSGTFTFAVKVQDNLGNTAISPTYTIVFSSAPDGKHNSYLKGRYSCLFNGYLDKNNSRHGFVLSILADGAGNFTGGVFDDNDSTTGAYNGTETGTYSLGSNNNGTASMTTVISGVSTPHKRLIMANNIAGPIASEFRMIESDDLGASPSGQHGAAVCYLDTTTAFVAATISGSSFAFGTRGETAKGSMKASVGRFSASGGTISAGIVDAAVGPLVTGNDSFSGSYTTPDATTGRFTGTFTTSIGSAHFAFYIIDANRMFMLRTDAGNFDTGEVRKQHQASYANANLTGNFALYFTEFQIDSSNTLQAYKSEIMQGSGDGAGHVTIHQSYSEELNAIGGTPDYRVGDANGTSAVTVSGNGRAVVAEGGVLYLYDNNSAFILDDSVGGSGYTHVGLGWVEPQTLTTFTDSAIAGTYLAGDLPPMNAGQNDDINLVKLDTSGNAAGIDDSAGPGEYDYASSLTATYSWSSTTLGTIAVTQAGQPVLSCIAISATRTTCIENEAHTPKVTLLEQ